MCSLVVFWCCWTDNKFKSLQLIPVAYLRVLKIRTSFKYVQMRVHEGSNPNPTSRVSHGIPFSIQGYPSACSRPRSGLNSALLWLSWLRTKLCRFQVSTGSTGSTGSTEADETEALEVRRLSASNFSRTCQDQTMLRENTRKTSLEKFRDGKSRSGSRPIQNHPVTSVTVVSDVLTCSGTFWYRHVPSICLKSIDVCNMLIYFACPPRENWV